MFPAAMFAWVGAKSGIHVLTFAPDGQYMAYCIGCFDQSNRIASLEPVGSIRLGYGREVVMEAVRRVAGLGARSVWVGSGQRFYKAIGFERRFLAHVWVKEL